MRLMPASAASRRLVYLCAALALTSACARSPVTDYTPRASGLDQVVVTRAIQQATDLRAQGKRVWCVPFARNVSGIEIRGNAHTWWHQAKGEYARTNEPHVGAVMVFSKSSRLSMGHIAVVSRIVSDREIEIDHANWERNEVSLGMSVIDISDRGDWSEVRVKSQASAYGSPYPVSGFILPHRIARDA
ncbi:CHAP domain-containing protein [Palleronia sediminis]|uniref:CHAP domain-containing protein n=1 Tax=Palleronia sediminis TaxID=2547833 RepID=A0A4R6ADY4_9RHOB|nr:CHAP domain-containing protein [Palleronia sediminis]TDL81232.1 CHAP domain-containing protein [Palleronia sediminis]